MASHKPVPMQAQAGLGQRFLPPLVVTNSIRVFEQTRPFLLNCQPFELLSRGMLLWNEGLLAVEDWWVLGRTIVTLPHPKAPEVYSKRCGEVRVWILLERRIRKV